MSFRADEGRRYGALPPVQYPVANQGQDQYPANLQRRNSFNTGDDSAFFDPGAAHPQEQSPSGASGDDLVMRHRPDGPQSPARQSYNSGSAISGYQHQYQAAQSPPTPTTYNPQAFARTQSQSLPYRPNPFAQPIALNRYPPTAATPSSYAQNSSSYTPAPYNPALYSSASPTAAPSRQPTYHGYAGGAYGQAYGSPTSPMSYHSHHSPYTPGPQPTQAPSPASQISYDHGLPSSQHSINTSAPTSATTAPGLDAPYSGYATNTYQSAGFYASDGGSTTTSYGGSASQVPYPTHSTIPVGPNYAASTDLGGDSGRGSRSNSQTSPLPSPPASQLPQRHPTNAPLPSRPPMAGLPEEDTWSPNGHVDDLVNQIEGQLDRGSSQGQRPAPINGSLSGQDLDYLRRQNSSLAAPAGGALPASNTSSANRTYPQYAYDGHEFESDQEEPYGVAATHGAEREHHRLSGGSEAYSYTGPQTATGLPPQPEEDSDADSDNVPFDLGLFGGGYAGNMSYGHDVGSPPPPGAPQNDLRLPTPQQQQQQQQLQGAYTGYESYRPFAEAGVDYEGTGGLQAPTVQPVRAYDEDGEQTSLHSKQSESDSPAKEDYPDMFFHPGIGNRPLPAIPAPGSDSSSMLSIQPPSRGHSHSLSTDSRPMYRPDAAGGYYSACTNVERSISLSTHSSTPPIHTPARSQTDAAADKRRPRSQVQPHLGAQFQEFYDADTPVSLSYDTITLPRGRRKLNPAKLAAADFGRCREPWALSSIACWAREMSEGESDLKKKTVEECLVNLFTYKVPTMNIADAETQSARVVQSMFAQGILIPEEEWVKWGPGEMSGVLWQLTGSGCYAPRVHEEEGTGRCYSYHCTRTVKKADLDGLQLAQSADSAPNWINFYGIKKEDLEGKDSKEITRQHVLHEIVTGEEEYMTQLDVLRILYRDQLRRSNPPLLAPAKMEKFVSAVFGRVESLEQCNKSNLLAQLKYRQKDQGPWIVGFSDLFREWIRKAKHLYIDYSYAYPYAAYMVRKEQARNLHFNKFLQEVQNHELSRRLDYVTYLKAPITRLQRYTLLLGTSLGKMREASEEKTNLEIAIEEIKAVTHECDAKVAEMQKKVDMMELEASLVLRPGFHAVLNLDHLGRELIYQGDLQRVGSKGVRWVDAHALLLDHYFILAKKIEAKDGKTGKKYDVSKEVCLNPCAVRAACYETPTCTDSWFLAYSYAPPLP